MYKKLEELRNESIICKDSGATFGLGITEERLCEMLKEFFGEPKNIVGLPRSTVLDLFESFCTDNGYPVVNRATTGRALRKFFGITRKKARVDGVPREIYIFENGARD